jgi:nitrate reductase NapD
MNVSGILVVTPEKYLQATIDNLNRLDGVEVHQTDPATGRIVITQEGRSVHDEIDGLKRIKALPHIILAEMIHHHFEQDREKLHEIPEDLDDAEGLPEVPAFLNR